MLSEGKLHTLQIFIVHLNPPARTFPVPGGWVRHVPQTSEVFGCGGCRVPSTTEDHDRLLARMHSDDIRKPITFKLATLYQLMKYSGEDQLGAADLVKCKVIRDGLISIHKFLQLDWTKVFAKVLPVRRDMLVCRVLA